MEKYAYLSMIYIKNVRERCKEFTILLMMEFSDIRLS
jgi:hypothetical protein